MGKTQRKHTKKAGKTAGSVQCTRLKSVGGPAADGGQADRGQRETAIPVAAGDSGKPILSIGMIFKNEIHCMERCLRSIQPLKAALPCELVMADTGSDDGSRAVAERYADTLFDFPWVQDFSAARNAVIARSRGRWYLTLDCDEWLEDISELIQFLTGCVHPGINGAMVVQRNYTGIAPGHFGDVLIGRLFRLEYLPRYVGAVHEYTVFGKTGGGAVTLSRTILHHDGYVEMNTAEGGRDKRRRNLQLLRVILRDDPDNFRTLLQFLDSGRLESDYFEYLRRAMELVRHGANGWEQYGPPIFERAVIAAYQNALPCLDAWAAEAEIRFGSSWFYRIDIVGIRCSHARDQADWAACLQYGAAYFAAREQAHTDPDAALARMTAPLKLDNAYNANQIRLAMLNATAQTGDPASLAACVREVHAILHEDPTLLPEAEAVLKAVRQRITEAKPELLALAEQIREILRMSPPDDPAVAALKASPAYQRVVWLIERE